MHLSLYRLKYIVFSKIGNLFGNKVLNIYFESIFQTKSAQIIIPNLIFYEIKLSDIPCNHIHNCVLLKVLKDILNFFHISKNISQYSGEIDKIYKISKTLSFIINMIFTIIALYSTPLGFLFTIRCLFKFCTLYFFIIKHQIT